MQQNIDQSVMYPQPHLVRTALTVGLRVGPSVGLKVRRGARCGAATNRHTPTIEGWQRKHIQDREDQVYLNRSLQVFRYPYRGFVR